jgi:PAS domain S-box-containing protein
MSKPDDILRHNQILRKKIIGLGDLSGRKSYYPELRRKIKQLEQEIIERNIIENELKEARNYIHNIFNSMPSILIGIDAEGKVVQWNAEVERVTRLKADQARGEKLESVFPLSESEKKILQQAVHNRQLLTGQKLEKIVDGEQRYVDITIYPLLGDSDRGTVIRIDDVTERVRMEQIIIQSEKMSTVGGLAAGMAHEINNPLGIILQAVQIIVQRLSPDLSKNLAVANAHEVDLHSLQAYLDERDIMRYLEEIKLSGLRASNIVKDMLQFSRKSEFEARPVELNIIVEQALVLARKDYDLKKNYDFNDIEIKKELTTDQVLVTCVKNEIEQVILNLLKNASQALFEQGRNTDRWIRLRTCKDKNTAKIEVEDNGPGIDPKVQKRIFEPFFTTKTVGKGTGLGLSVSYMIITNHHRGTIEVNSDGRSGTRFTICLPIDK